MGGILPSASNVIEIVFNRSSISKNHFLDWWVKIVGCTRGTKLVSRYYRRKALSLWGLCPISILLNALSLESYAFWGELLQLWAFSFRSWTIFLFAISNFSLSLAMVFYSSLIYASSLSLSSLLFLLLFYFLCVSSRISFVNDIFFFLANYSSLLAFSNS